MPTLASVPTPGPSTATSRRPTPPRDHRYADRLLRRRRLCGQDGLRPSLTRAPIEPLKVLLAAARRVGMHVIHTREGHRPDLPTCPPTSAGARSRSARALATPAPAAASRARASPAGTSFPSFYPIEGEPIIDKPGKGSFCATDLELILHTRGIRNLILTGITTDVCVHTTMREANDRGFECVMLSDCTGATDPGKPRGGAEDDPDAGAVCLARWLIQRPYSLCSRSFKRCMRSNLRPTSSPNASAVSPPWTASR